MKQWRINPYRSSPFSKKTGFWRVNLILIFIILFGAAVGARLFFLQILQYDFYKALAYGQQKIFSPSQGERGEIFLSNNELLAANIWCKYLYISPKEIKEQERTAAILGEVLGLSQEHLLEKIKKDNLFELVKNRLSDEELAVLGKVGLAGVYFGEEKCRDYPQGSLASHVVGFFGGSETGQYGVEEYWDDALSGAEGLSGGERGADLILTINYDIQYFAEKLLKEAFDSLNIEKGTIIVMEPHSGKLLALANFPGFDPNQYSKEKNFNIFLNTAVQERFEPGSVFKAVTMAAALNEERVTPQTTYIDKGKLQIGGYTIYNYGERVWGERTMTEVLEKSINTGAVFVESQIGHKVFLDYVSRFGILKKTGIDLPGELDSPNDELKRGYEINFATASFGQGIAMTPIQLARTFCVIANAGKLIKPYVVEKIVGSDKIIETQPEVIADNIISQEAASRLTAMLVSVVENGFGKGARVPGYYIAGKTGTAQVSWSALGEKDKSGYSPKTIQSFVGFAPALDPQFLILVKLDNPETGTAEYSAVPIFQKLAKYIIDRFQIPPDYE